MQGHDVSTSVSERITKKLPNVVLHEIDQIFCTENILRVTVVYRA